MDVPEEKMDGGCRASGAIHHCEYYLDLPCKPATWELAEPGQGMCARTRVHACTRVCMCAHTCMCACVCLCACVCTRVCMCACVRMCVCGFHRLALGSHCCWPATAVSLTVWKTPPRRRAGETERLWLTLELPAPSPAPVPRPRQRPHVRSIKRKRPCFAKPGPSPDLSK